MGRRGLKRQLRRQLSEPGALCTQERRGLGLLQSTLQSTLRKRCDAVYAFKSSCKLLHTFYISAALGSPSQRERAQSADIFRQSCCLLLSLGVGIQPEADDRLTPGQEQG